MAGGVPHVRVPVGVPGGDVPAVGAEGDGGDLLPVGDGQLGGRQVGGAARAARLRAGRRQRGRVPQVGAAGVAGGQDGAVGAERNGGGRRLVAGVARVAEAGAVGRAEADLTERAVQRPQQVFRRKQLLSHRPPPAHAKSPV